ncbi:hypothetical protein CJ030_MR4G009210 [Morella rubra]|uniref:Uncharacterized protein n=1 Tax=Morella rubra TaxID=262757 RepID=A0A6A1VVY3_9ROSI|nr:hypothetical protein CJ030_MR4G009210 [Morella rubra]
MTRRPTEKPVLHREDAAERRLNLVPNVEAAFQEEEEKGLWTTQPPYPRQPNPVFLQRHQLRSDGTDYPLQSWQPALFSEVRKRKDHSGATLVLHCNSSHAYSGVMAQNDSHSDLTDRILSEDHGLDYHEWEDEGQEAHQ